MKRIRSTVKEAILHNKWNNEQTQIGATEIHYDLTTDGGIQEHEVQHLVALPCGHFATTPKGLCSICSRALCEACCLTCEACGRPIGKCHGVEDPDGKGYCSECHAARKRRLLLRLLVSPLVRFSEETWQ